MTVRGAALVTALATAALSWPTAAGASVFAGHSGWFWSSPLPQGNTLRAIDFSGYRGYAVGDFGTVMRTDDGGTTWTGLTTGTTTPLRLVRTIDPETVVVAGKCTVRRSDDGGRTFAALPWRPSSRTCSIQVKSLAFPTSQSGYLLLADGTLLHTSDAGQTWAKRTAVPNTTATNPASKVQPTDLFFPSADLGFAVTEAGTVYRTTDGGTSWSPVAQAAQHLDSVYFRDATTGFVAGGASVLRTADGGVTWVQQGIVTPPESLAWIRCGGEHGCVAATAQGDELLRSDDGGVSWTPTSPASQPLFAAAYTSAGGVVAVGDGGGTVTSADGGHNFTTISAALDGIFSLVRAASPTVAYAAGRGGMIARTTDGGQTWGALTPPGAGDIVDISFPSPETGFALAKQNVLTRTEDGGKTWRLLDVGSFLKTRSMTAPDARHVVLATQRGLRRSRDGGASFARVRVGLAATGSFKGTGAAGNSVYAFGRRALVISTDGGATWKALPLPPHEQLKAIDFASSTVAYALTRDGRAWKTSDRARTWRQLRGLGTQIGAALAFGDPTDGYIAVPEFGHDQAGYVMRTTDGGLTWRPQLADSQPIGAGALDAAGSNSAFAVGGRHHLLATDRGGDIGRRTTLTLSINRQRPGRPGVIAVTGTLTPAKGGETVVVSKRESKSSHWLFSDVTVSSSGHFTVFTTITKTTSFVAQWSGDDDQVGAGTRAVVVAVGPKFTPK